MGRPEADEIHGMAMNVLGLGLTAARHHTDALSVREAELSLMRRVGAPEERTFSTQGNLAISYQVLGRHEEAIHMRREVYSGRLKLLGEEHRDTLVEANNYAHLLLCVRRCEEAKSLMRRKIPVVRRVLGETNMLTFQMRMIYARALYGADGATLDDVREAATSLEELERTARRVLGSAHPLTTGFESNLRKARAALRTYNRG